jgi:hypothetical protein
MISRSRFDQVSPELLEAVRDGASIDEACRGRDLKVRTVRDWLYRGRKDPQGPYGAFAAAVDGIRASRELPAPSRRGSLSRDEWESCVALAVRAGNVPAMKLWLDSHGDSTPADDVFAEFES